MPPPINAEGYARDVITIGASAGGVQALMQLLAKLPSDLPAVIGIVLHRSPFYETQLPVVLGRHAVIDVLEPADGTRLEHGTAYVAPRDTHLLFVDGHARLHHGPKEHRTRPAADPLFRSAAAGYGPRVAGVVLTGLGSDGVPGLVAIKAAGGLSLVQDPREAMYPTMPSRAIAEDNVDASLSLDRLAVVLTALARGYAVDRASHALLARGAETVDRG